MAFSKRRHDYRRAVQAARADFLTNALRKHLPPGSLWHEKRFAAAQLESLVIVSTGGMYDVDTFDRTDLTFAPREEIAAFDDLGIRVRHQEDTHETLSEVAIKEILQSANLDFETLLADERGALTSSFRRITCTIEFTSPDDDIQRHAQTLIAKVAAVLDLPVTYIPYVARDLWLPTSDYPDGREMPENARRAFEFVLDEPWGTELLTQRIQSAIHANRRLSARGLHGTVSSDPPINDLHLIGRYF
jgi:hypothetical protein